MRRVFLALICVVLGAALPAPALAANGQIAAFADGKLVAINPDGSGLRTIWTPSEGAVSGLAWSPDGNKLAFSYQGKITIYDTVERTLTSLPSSPGVQDLDPAWNATGDRIGFRRVGPIFQQRIRVGLSGDVVGSADLDVLTSAFSFGKSLTKYVFTLGPLLDWSGGGLGLSNNAQATPPGWAPNEVDFAYAEGGSLQYPPGLRVVTTAAPFTNRFVAELPAANPRFSPDGASLVYIAAGELKTVPLDGAARPAGITGLQNVTSVDWQPCTSATGSCVSVTPPRCSGPTAQVRTQADQPVELVAPSCWDPAGRPLSVVVTLAPERGTISGTTYTPAPGFVGQDTVTFKVSNGASESETIRVTIFVVPRPAQTGPPQASVQPPAAAPFLSLRVKPRLDRKRMALARLSCDQACAFSVRLEAKVRVKKKSKTLKGTVVKRSLAAGEVLALRLKLPRKPAGTLKTIWITGTVRGANGAGRPVKLPVSPPAR